MRAYLPDYDLRSPATLGEALGLLSDKPGTWRVFAGGTDLMVLLEAGKLDHKRFLSLWHVSELRGIQVSPDSVTIGALSTYTDIRRNQTLQSEFPLLCRAAQETGGVATQNRGTLGGNIANASPAADSPPALLVYDAELELLSDKGSRRIPYHGFHSGYKQMDLRPDELIAQIHLRRPKSKRLQYYRKVGTRRAQAISKVCFAAAAENVAGILHRVRISLGSVAPIPLRCTATEKQVESQPITPALIAAAQATLDGEISPIDDMRSSARYRRRIAGNLLTDFLQKASLDAAR